MRVDFEKLKLKEVFFFLAGVFPGLIVIATLAAAYPEVFARFSSSPFPGYKVKIASIVVLAFVVGNSLTTLLMVAANAIGPVLGGLLVKLDLQSAGTNVAAPWRDPKWRNLVTQQIAPNVPGQAAFVSDELYAMQRRGFEGLPEPERNRQIAELGARKFLGDVADQAWAEWYDHYHYIVLNPADRPVEWHIQTGLAVNLATGALWLVGSMIFLPAARKWWCISFACLWFAVAVIATLHFMWNLTHPWRTYSIQLKYLESIRK
jgi:hypothetical protein